MLLSYTSWGQLSYLELDPRIIHILDRHAPDSLTSFHPSIRNADRIHVFQFLSLIDLEDLNQFDESDIKYLLRESSELKYNSYYGLNYPSDSIVERSGLFASFYRYPESFLEFAGENFFLKIDPIIHFSIGDEGQSQGVIFQNTRGLKMRGSIDSKVYWHFNILETQRSFLDHIERDIEQYGAIPGQGFL